MLLGKLALVAGGSLIAISPTAEGLERIGGWGIGAIGLYTLWNQLNEERKSRDEMYKDHMEHLSKERDKSDVAIAKIDEALKEAADRADERSERFLNALGEVTKQVGKLDDTWRESLRVRRSNKDD